MRATVDLPDDFVSAGVSGGSATQPQLQRSLGHANRLCAAALGRRSDDGFRRLPDYQGRKDVPAEHARQGPEGRGLYFFNPTKLEDGKLRGQAVHKGTTGVPILDAAPAAVECRATSIVEQGDHHIVVGEVVEAHLPKPISGRSDAAIIEMKDLGDNVSYGG
ncbi:MAG: flavin reductase [Alphaproteobacteria bacterium]|nr:flavin reductase [Alphaproteobacteria bacterium]